MKRVPCLICLAALVLIFSLASVGTAKEGVVMPTDSEKAEVGPKVELFSRTVSYGEAGKNPLVLLSAVSLLDELSFTRVARPGGEGKESFYDRASLLSLAKKYADGDAELLRVIAKVENPPEKTVVRGQWDGHGGYYHRGNVSYHGSGERQWGCYWLQRCHRGDCVWVCR